MNGSRVVCNIRACLPFFAVFALSGCSASDDSLPRHAVAGTVLLDGQRLAEGSILFEPIQRPVKGDDSLPTGNHIVNGRFTLPRRIGLTFGMYKILIFSEIRHAANRGMGQPIVEEIIPVRFNAKTELELDVKREIKDLRIEIESK